MNIDVDDRSYDGLPDNLTVKDENDLPRVFSVIPGFNRDTRRSVAAVLRSMHRQRSTSKRSDADAIVAAFRQSRFRRLAFWREIGKQPVRAGYARRSLYMSVDFWLLRAIEPDLSNLPSVEDDDLRNMCPPWDQISANLVEWADEHSLKVDKRYFGLWPAIRAMLDAWSSLSHDDRVKASNAAFALSSIAGSVWFVDEARRVCPSIASEYVGLTEEHNHSDGKSPKAQETETSAAGEVSIYDADPSATEDSVARWRIFGDDLKQIATKLIDGEIDASVIEALDDVFSGYEQLKQECPPYAPPSSRAEGLLNQLYELIDEIGRQHVGGLLDEAAREGTKLNWSTTAERAARGELETDLLIADAERAGSMGRKHSAQLANIVRARAEAEDEHSALQETERKATSSLDRKAARRALAQLEVQLASFRRDEETVEEDLSRDLQPFPDIYAADAKPSESFGSPMVALGPDGPSRTISTAAEENELQSSAQAEDSHPGDSVVASVGENLIETPTVSNATTEEVQISGVPEDRTAEPARGQVDEAFSVAAGNLCMPIWQALRIEDAALAYHAATALNKIEPSIIIPAPALLAAVALAQRLQSPSGPIADAIQQCFGEIDRDDFETGPELWRLANNLLLLAACLRPLILAPDSGVSGISQYVHLGPGLGPLFEVQSLLSDYGQRLKGSRLDAAALGAVRSRTAWETEFEQLQRDINEWLERAPRFTANFRAATDVWRQWMSNGGEISQLMGHIKAQDAFATTDVQAICDLLSKSASFRALVDDTDRKRLKRNRGEDIHARAFEQLAAKSEEAVGLGKRWLSLLEARPEHGDYLNKVLGELHSKLKKSAGVALNALEAEVQDDVWGLVKAARSTVKMALLGVLNLFAGERSPGASEPSANAVLGAPLLYMGAVSLNVDWRPESSANQLLEEIKIFLARRPSTRDAFDALLARGDLVNAQRLLELVGDDRPAGSDLLTDLERAGVRKREEIHSESKKVEEEISLALAYGLIGEEERGRLSSRVAALELGPIADLRFDLAKQVLAELQEEIARSRATRAHELVQRLEHLKIAHPDFDGTVIDTVIAEGDFPTATEYLHRAEQDPNAPMNSSGARDLFNDFFPRGSKQLEHTLSLLDASRMLKVIAEGKTAGGINYGGLSRGRAEASAATWGQWCKLKSSRAPSAEALKALMQALGFRDSRVTATGAQSAQQREFVLLTSSINAREICQIPHFGSRAEGKYRLVCLWDPPTQEEFRTLAGDATTGPATIALYFGKLPEARRRELSHVSRGDRKLSFLLLDELLLLFICGEENAPLSAFFQCTLPFTHSDPFVTTSSVVPPEMFFGRSEELASIKSMDGRCFVYGGRQLGKTALLRQAEREFHNPAEGRIAAWIDLKRVAQPDEIWVPIWRELKRYGVVGDKIAEPRRTDRATKKIEEFLQATEEWVTRHPESRVLLLLDEADRFLEFDARDGFVDTRRLKGLMELSQRRFKVVFAGLHNVLRTTEHANHPLAHFGEAIEVGPLIRPDDLRAARDLVLRPLMAAGFAFENERRVDRILAQTNYYPSLIQLYCSKLLHELLRNDGIGLDRRNGPRYTISTKQLDAVYGRQDLRDEIRTKFLLTLQLDPRYNLITYALAHEVQQGRIKLDQGAAVEEFRRIADVWWTEGFSRTSEPAFRVLLREMVGLGVLRQLEAGRFTLRNPNVLLLLGSASEIDEELCRPRALPAEYEPRFWRMALGADAAAHKRNPLTVSQVADVVSPNNGVIVVAGSEAAGILDVQEAVRTATETGFFLAMEAGGASPAAFQRTLDRLGDRKSGGTTVLFVGPDCPWTIGWLQLAVARVERLKSKDNPVRVVLAADPTTLRLMVEEGIPPSVPLVSLESWSDDYLREWLNETNQSSEASVRSRILTDTGGWPEFIYEWKESTGRKVDAASDARIRLKRLGVEDEAAILDLDEKPVSNSGAIGTDERQFRLIRWAEILGLLRTAGDGKVHLEPYVAELLMRV